MVKYKFKETKKIRELLIKIEALKIVFDQIKVLPGIEQNIQRQSLLKSALYSARIEGIFSKSEKKLEVSNLLSAYKYIYSVKSPKKLSLNFIKKLHELVMKKLSARPGSWRDEAWAIFNQAGVAVYLAPPAQDLPDLMSEFLRISNNLKWEGPIKAGIIQFLFEKIHPFADGNGRVGRLLSTAVMNKGGFGFRGLVSVEEIIDKNRETYYRCLEPSNDTTFFVEFFLESFIKQAEQIFIKLNQKTQEVPEDSLLPRRREILEIIRDHPYSSFDFISRRFSAINPKTLHNDLNKLQKHGLIIKAGKTRAATYKAK